MRDLAATSWIDEKAAVDRLELTDGAWVDVVRGLVPLAGEVHDELVTSVQWEQGRVFRYERWVPEPRLSGHQRGGRRHPALAATERWISRRYRVPVDGVSLARYRHMADSVAFHRDRELRWLEDTLVAVLSLGARRAFLLRPLGGRWRGAEPDRGEPDRADVIDLAPAGGDLIVMGGRCQAAWLHAVPKSPVPVRSRISAQWRWTSRRGRPDTNPSYRAPRRFSS